MKFTPEFHLKMASILLWAARATTGHRKPRLESLGHAFRIRAKQLAQSNGVTPDELSLFDTKRIGRIIWLICSHNQIRSAEG